MLAVLVSIGLWVCLLTAVNGHIVIVEVAGVGDVLDCLKVGVANDIGILKLREVEDCSLNAMLLRWYWLAVTIAAVVSDTLEERNLVFTVSRKAYLLF